MPKNTLDWSDLLEKKSLSAEEELCKAQWLDKPKTPGAGFSFKHVEANKATGDHPHTLHTFHVSHNNKPIGRVYAKHESDNIDASHSNVTGSGLKHEALKHLQSHLNNNYDHYAKMKKH